MSGGSGVPSLFASTIEDTDKLGQRRFSSANKYVQKDVDLGIVIGDDLKEKLSKQNPGRFELSKNSRATTKVGIGGRRQVGGGRKRGGVDIFALMDSAMETGPTEEAKQKAREEAAAKKAIEEAPILKPKKVVKKKAKSLNPLKSPTKNNGIPALFASSVHGDTSTEKEPAWKTRLKEKSEKPLETIVSPEKTVLKVKLESKPNVGKARKKGGLDIFGAIDNAMESGPTAEAKEKAREEAASKKAIEATPIPQKTPKKKSKSLAPVSSSNVPSLFASPVESTKSGKEPAWKTRMREAQQNIQSDTDQTKAEKQKLSPVVAKTTASSHMTFSDNEMKDKDFKAGAGQANEEKQESPPAGERLYASTDDKIIDENGASDVDQTKKATQELSPVIDKFPAAITETKSGDKTSEDEFSGSVSDVESDELDDKADDPPRGTSIKASHAEPPAVAEINVESNLSPRSLSASDTAQNGPRDSPKKSPVKRTPKENLRASSPKIKSPRTVSSSPQKSPVSETTSSTNLSSAPSSKSTVDGPVSEPVQLAKASPEPVHLKKTTPPTEVVDKADSSDESDSSDDQEDNYPSAFKFTATPKTNFYRSSDSDSDSDSSSDDDDIRGTFQLGEDGDVTGLPSADIEFSVDDDKETRQFLFQLEDSLVSTHTADWYRDQINETEKRLQASLVNHKLQQAELTKLVDRKKESMGDIFEGKMDVRRRMGAKQEKTFQKAYDEEQKIVESLRKENKRVRGEVNKLPRQILEIKNSIIGLEAANEEIEGHLESLGKFSKKLERDHEKLQASSAKCRDVYLPRYRNELRQRETHIEIETRIKNLYRSCILKISRSLGERKRIELQEIANDLILETEADVNPKFDPKVLFESDSESDSSSSDDSDSDSSSNDSDSD